MNLLVPPIHCLPRVPRADRGSVVQISHEDEYGSYQIVDVSGAAVWESVSSPYPWFVHVVSGNAEVKSKGSATYRQLPKGAFCQLPAEKAFRVRSRGADAVRVIVIQRNAEQGQLVRTRVWSTIDAIPLTQRPMDIALWSAWKETDLPRGIGYEYFAIGKVPQYSRVYISEARAHVHQNSDSFIYVISGAGVCVLGKEEYAIGEGNLIVVPRGLRHALRGSFVASSGQWGGEIDNDYTPK